MYSSRPESVDELLDVLALLVLRVRRLLRVLQPLRHGALKHVVVALRRQAWGRRLLCDLVSRVGETCVMLM